MRRLKSIIFFVMILSLVFSGSVLAKEKDVRSEKVTQELQMMFANGSSKEDIDKYLINNELVELVENNISVEEISAKSEPNDVGIDNTYVFYDRLANRWYAMTSGSWKTNDYDAPFVLLPYVGLIKNVGNRDAVGITLYNTSGTPAPTISSSAYFTDGASWYQTSSSPSFGDGTAGACFEIQDKIKITEVNLFSYNYRYLGATFGCTITYGSDFTYYNGFARGFYIHTYDSCVINDVSFGVDGKTFGCSVSISSQEEGFTVFDDSDTSF